MHEACTKRGEGGRTPPTLRPATAAPGAPAAAHAAPTPRPQRSTRPAPPHSFLNGAPEQEAQGSGGGLTDGMPRSWRLLAAFAATRPGAWSRKYTETCRRSEHGLATKHRAEVGADLGTTGKFFPSRRQVGQVCTNRIGQRFAVRKVLASGSGNSSACGGGLRTAEEALAECMWSGLTR
jgi:hypothetical protein